MKSGTDIEDNIRAYNEALQYRIREVLNDVNQDMVTDVIINKLAEAELVRYAEKIVDRAIANFVEEQTKELSNLIYTSLKEVLSAQHIEAAMKDQETLNILAKAICIRFVQNTYYED